MMEIFYYPTTALAIAIALTLLTWSQIRRAAPLRRILLVIGPAAWFIYFVYETYMVYVWEPTVIAPIRLDLTFILPVLAATTAIAVLAWSLRRT